VSRGERAPRLTLRFVLWTAVGVTAAATAVFLLLARDLTLQAEHEAIARAEVTSHAVLGTSLRPSDLAAPAPPARRRTLDALFHRHVLVGGPVRASLVGRDGIVLYSTDHALLGTKGPPASAGTVASHVADAGGTVGRALELIVPLSVDERRAGELVLEQPYAPLAAQARRTALELAAVVEVLFLLLLAALAPPLGRASARLRRHVEELDHLAMHDQLLGVPNRLGVERQLEKLAGSSWSPSPRSTTHWDPAGATCSSPPGPAGSTRPSSGST
jgi:hypothetical protein